LHVAHDFALQPYRVSDRSQQHEDDDRRLDHRHEYENADWQRLNFLSQKSLE